MFRKFTGCTERRMGIRKIYQKGNFSVSPLLEIHWLGRTEVPANYYHRPLTGNVQEFLFFNLQTLDSNSPNSFMSTQYPYMVNSTCRNAEAIGGE